MEDRINVPRSVSDPHYRYTMPALRVKVEGRGKMIKTIIMNLPEVARDVFRSPEYLLRFFGFELGASTQIDSKEINNPKYIIIGNRTLSDLNVALDKFIDQFVLCESCHNPETVISTKKNVNFRCMACGHSTVPNPVHKLTNFILKHPPTGAEDSKTFKKEKKPTVEKEDNWAVDTSESAIEHRRKQLSGGMGDSVFGSDEQGDEKDDSNIEEENGQNEHEPVVLSLSPGDDPLALMSKYWKSNPPKESVAGALQKLQAEQKWSDSQLFNLVFGSLFDQNLEKNFEKKADRMKLFVAKPKDQKQLLFCVEKLCQMHPTLITHISAILQHFYTSGMLSDDVVFDWWEEPSKKIPQKISQEIRKEGEKFIKWLEEAEDQDQ